MVQDGQAWVGLCTRAYRIAILSLPVVGVQVVALRHEATQELEVPPPIGIG